MARIAQYGKCSSQGRDNYHKIAGEKTSMADPVPTFFVESNFEGNFPNLFLSFSRRVASIHCDDVPNRL